MFTHAPTCIMSQAFLAGGKGGGKPCCYGPIAGIRTNTDWIMKTVATPLQNERDSCFPLSSITYCTGNNTCVGMFLTAENMPYIATNQGRQQSGETPTHATSLIRLLYQDCTLTAAHVARPSEQGRQGRPGPPHFSSPIINIYLMLRS